MLPLLRQSSVKELFGYLTLFLLSKLVRIIGYLFLLQLPLMDSNQNRIFNNTKITFSVNR